MTGFALAVEIGARQRSTVHRCLRGLPRRCRVSTPRNRTRRHERGQPDPHSCRAGPFCGNWPHCCYLGRRDSAQLARERRPMPIALQRFLAGYRDASEPVACGPRVLDLVQRWSDGGLPQFIAGVTRAGQFRTARPSQGTCPRVAKVRAGGVCDPVGDSVGFGMNSHQLDALRAARCACCTVGSAYVVTDGY